MVVRGFTILVSSVFYAQLVSKVSKVFVGMMMRRDPVPEEQIRLDLTVLDADTQLFKPITNDH